MVGLLPLARIERFHHRVEQRVCSCSAATFIHWFVIACALLTHHFDRLGFFA